MIAELVALKADFERATGTPFDPPKKTKAKKAPAAAAGKDEKKGGNKARSAGGWRTSLRCPVSSR